jgi:hypothetical protein
VVREFQDPDSELRFFVGNPRTGGYGLTLTAADTVVYFSNSFDLEVRLQSEDRAHRIGQTKSVTYVDLFVPGTIDEKIVKALRAKIDNFCQLAAYALAHDKIHGTTIDNAVVLMAVRSDGSTAEFSTAGREFQGYKDMWMRRVDQFHEAQEKTGVRNEQEND